MDKTLSYFNEWNDSSLLDHSVKWIDFSTILQNDLMMTRHILCSSRDQHEIHYAR